MTIEEHLERSKNALEFFGATIVDIPCTIRMGNSYWRTFDAEQQFGFIVIHARWLFTIQDDLVIIMIINTPEGAETPEEILLMFEDL